MPFEPSSSPIYFIILHRHVVIIVELPSPFFHRGLIHATEGGKWSDNSLTSTEIRARWKW